MAGRLDTLLYEVRRLVKDRRPNAYVFPSTFLEEIAREEVPGVVDDTGMGKLETNLCNVAVDTDLYQLTLPTAYLDDASAAVAVPNLRMLNELVTTTLNWPLQKYTREQITDLKSGPTKRRGNPLTGFCIYEDANGATWLWVDPIPTVADVLKAVWEPLHPDVNMRQVVLMLNVAQLMILRLRVAATALDSATPAMLDKLGVSPAFAGTLRGRADESAATEYFRLNAGHRVGSIVRGR